MKKALSTQSRMIAMALAVFMCLSLITITAFAEGYGNEYIQLEKSTFEPDEEFVITVTGITEQMWLPRYNDLPHPPQIGLFTMEEAGPSGNKHPVFYDYPSVGTSQHTRKAPVEPGEYLFKLYYYWYDEVTTPIISSLKITVIGEVATTPAPQYDASDWAQPELAKADALDLIPDSLIGADLTKPITRAEFAAVAVKVYENLSGTKTTPSATTTFTDTTDTEVLKAHNTDLMVGVSAGKFDPNALLNREQAATALTRVLKRAYIPDWTFATDGNFKLNFTRPATFADDTQISDWAKESVYFMAANEIIKGVGENKFAPKAVTSAEQAAGYASATREQAIIIGMRLVDNLKGKDLPYTQG